MREKQTVTRQLAVEYKRATKKQKGRILDALNELTGYGGDSSIGLAGS